MLKRILPGIYTLSGLIFGRVYLIIDSDGLTLVDAGNTWHWRAILSSIEKSNLSLRRVRRIVITHAHPDHAGNLPALKEATGAEIYAPDGESDVIEGARAMESVHLGATSGPPAWFPKLYLPACKVDHRLRENDLVPAMGGLQALNAPGHTMGQMVYWQAENRVLFCGDVAIRFPRLRPPFNVFTQDADENYRSIKKLIALGPETLLPGHGQPILSGATGELVALIERMDSRID